MIYKRIGHRYIDLETNTTLDTWYARDNQSISRSCLAQKVGLITSDIVEVETDLDTPPKSVEDAYLKLHLLSECLVRPNELNLDGLFACLVNVAWTSAGPILPKQVDNLRARIADHDHHLTITSIDNSLA